MPGYKRGIELGLAVELCGSYGKDPSQVLIANATDAIRTIKKANLPQVNSMTTDLSLMMGGGPARSVLEGPF